MSGQLLTVDFRNRRVTAACSDCCKRPSEPGSAWCRTCDEYRAAARKLSVQQAFRAYETSLKLGQVVEGRVVASRTRRETGEHCYDLGRSLESAMRDECPACGRRRARCTCFDSMEGDRG